jgi:c-di-GMP-related signal transduction protein
MKSTDQTLLEEAYGRIFYRNKKILADGKNTGKEYEQLAKDFAERLKEIFGTRYFTKTKIVDIKDKFEDLNARYMKMYDTPHPLFWEDHTRLSSLISKTAILRDDLKMEEGPKEMIYWFAEAEDKSK